MMEVPYDKPVRELLHDIRENADVSRDPHTFVDTKLVNRITYLAAVATLLSCSAMMIAMIWEAVDPLLGFRTMGTVLVVFAALLLFRGINYQFAE